MPMIAQKRPYTLIVMEDDMLCDPRNDENFGNMVCWHGRHDLGDPHEYKNPEDFLRQMMCDICCSNQQMERQVYEYIRARSGPDVRLTYNDKIQRWELYMESYGIWCKIEEENLLQSCLSVLKISELEKLLERSKCIALLPLYLYDHSGLTMNTTGFYDQWDSGQVGWIYADHEAIEKEYGEVTNRSIMKAKERLLNEVQLYDSYLTGECYGYQLLKNGEEIDNHWGFLGDINGLSD